MCSCAGALSAAEEEAAEDVESAEDAGRAEAASSAFTELFAVCAEAVCAEEVSAEAAGDRSCSAVLLQPARKQTVRKIQQTDVKRKPFPAALFRQCLSVRRVFSPAFFNFMNDLLCCRRMVMVTD